jgi:hypothetical protein
MIPRVWIARSVRAATVLMLATALLAASAQGGGLPRLLVWDGHGLAVRPESIYYTRDGSGVIGRLPSAYRAVGKRPGGLHWKIWDSARAVGVGTVWIKSCVPDCAGSPFYSHRLTITATRVRDGEFMRMTLRYRYAGNPGPTRGASWGRGHSRAGRTVGLLEGLATRRYRGRWRGVTA